MATLTTGLQPLRFGYSSTMDSMMSESLMEVGKNGYRKIDHLLRMFEIIQGEITKYKKKEPDKNIRVYLDYVRNTLGSKSKLLVDVRSPKEFTGEITAPPEYPTEHAQRGGHIPGAINIPWSQAVNDADGTFKSIGELKTLYETKGITPDKEIITYCRIGERSSHTWFALKYLLGYPNVKNYDGSWTEWGNIIANPIEK